MIVFAQWWGCDVLMEALGSYCMKFTPLISYVTLDKSFASQRGFISSCEMRQLDNITSLLIL